MFAINNTCACVLILDVRWYYGKIHTRPHPHTHTKRNLVVSICWLHMLLKAHRNLQIWRLSHVRWPNSRIQSLHSCKNFVQQFPLKNSNIKFNSDMRIYYTCIQDSNEDLSTRNLRNNERKNHQKRQATGAFLNLFSAVVKQLQIGKFGFWNTSNQYINSP